MERSYTPKCLSFLGFTVLFTLDEIWRSALNGKLGNRYDKPRNSLAHSGVEKWKAFSANVT